MRPLRSWSPRRQSGRIAASVINGNGFIPEVSETHLGTVADSLSVVLSKSTDRTATRHCLLAAKQAGPPAAGPDGLPSGTRTLSKRTRPPWRTVHHERCLGPSRPVAFRATGLTLADVAFVPNRLTFTFDLPNDRSLGRLRGVRVERGRSVKSDLYLHGKTGISSQLFP